MTTHQETAVDRFANGYNCAQAVLVAFAPDLGIDADHALRLACGFGGGIARQQEICGALSGGVIALGLKHGRGENQDKARTADTYVKVRELVAAFEDAHGTHVCRELLDGCDLSTPEGQERFHASGLPVRVCQPCVRTVVSALERLL
ncbi:MAG TPA: C-GCAxxG-C-C family protein [Thermoanaerobaculia bacterium]|nr:C-GCAxxG-C-C family protein [Thermoanaerobaculia bacterium]HQN06488.1 C-GCAxxG-C-C family protein [Thermoanaerobaculia bacterium]HQP84850.1 C-GCAxxG-C-C family protein [Thermoanaerobaculia bacterium]